MSRATDDVFDELHELTATALIEQIKQYRKDKQPIPPALLAQALKFMKDNGIDSPARAKKFKDDLDGKMPSLEDVEQEHATGVH